MVILPQDQFSNASCKSSLARWIGRFTSERVVEAGEQECRAESNATSGRLVYNTRVVSFQVPQPTLLSEHEAPC